MGNIITIAILGLMVIMEEKNYLADATCNGGDTTQAAFTVNSPSSTTINVNSDTYTIDIEALGIFTPNHRSCKLSSLICAATLTSDLASNGDGTYNFANSIANSAALGFSTSGSSVTFDSTQMTYSSSFTNLDIVILCYYSDYLSTEAIISATLNF